MSGIHDLSLFVAAGLLLNLTPGPDLAYIAARSASGGFRDGAAAVLGITAGCFVHTFAAALGLSALLATSATAFEIIRWCGALYLLYAGVRLLVASTRDRADGRAATSSAGLRARGGAVPLPSPGRAPSRAREATQLPATNAGRIFREALLINVFNPKVALFFLAFVPQFIAVDAPDKSLAFVALGALFNFNSLFVNLPVAWLASRASRRLRGAPRALPWLQRVTGCLFVALAARLATVSRN